MGLKVEQYVYGERFQIDVISLMAMDPSFLPGYADAIEPAYFDDYACQVLVGIIKDYWIKYGRLPARTSLEAEIADHCQRRKPGDATRDDIYSTLDSAMRSDFVDREHLIEKVVAFGRRQAVKEGITRVARTIENPDDEAFESEVARLQKSLMIGTGCSDLGLNLSDSFLSLPEIARTSEMYAVSRRIPTSINTLDRCLRNGIAPGELGFVVGMTGRGKTYVVDTKVLMADGTMKMVQDVRVGDQVMGDDSKPRNVLSSHGGSGPLFKFTPVKGESFTTNGDHELVLYDDDAGYGHGHSKVTEYDRYRAEDGLFQIPVKDYLGLPKSFRDVLKIVRTGVDFVPRSVKIDPYFLGIWLGGGNSQIGDKEYERGDGVAGARHHTRGVDERNSLLDDLRSYGLVQEKTSEGTQKRIPHEYKCNSRDVRLALLAGILDTDGHLHYGGYDVFQESEEFANDIAYVVRSLGLAAYVKECEKGCQTGSVGVYYRVTISGDCSILPLRVPRKKVPLRKQIKNVLITGISSVEPVGIGDYYGFEVDGNHRFLLGDFTISHNSVTLVNFAAAAVEIGMSVVYYSMELHEIDVALRIAARLSRKKTDEILADDVEYYETMMMLMAGSRPRIRVKYWPPKTVRVSAIRSHLSRLQGLEEGSPDLIIVDYADKLIGTRNVGDTYGEMGDVCDGLISVAHDFSLPVWTASQVRRDYEIRKKLEDPGFVLDLDCIADSFRKATDADTVVTLNQTRDEKSNGQMRLYTAKVRRGRDGEIVQCSIDYDRMLLEERWMPDAGDATIG